MTHHTETNTAHKTTQTIKDTLHTMNAMQIQLQLQLNKLILIKNKYVYTIHWTVTVMKYLCHEPVHPYFTMIFPSFDFTTLTHPSHPHQSLLHFTSFDFTALRHPSLPHLSLLPFLACLLNWKWKRYVPPKCRLTFAVLQGVIWASAVGIATGYGLDDRGGLNSSPGRVKNFLFFTSSRPNLGFTQPSIEWVSRALSPGVKRQGREADHSPPASAEVKKIWIYTSIPPYAFMA
jgi:hypothetical protein